MLHVRTLFTAIDLKLHLQTTDYGNFLANEPVSAARTTPEGTNENQDAPCTKMRLRNSQSHTHHTKTHLVRKQPRCATLVKTHILL
jgi:hypothetical protein